MTQPLAAPFSYHYGWDPTVFRRANRLVFRHAKHPAWLQVILKAAPWIAGVMLALWLSVIALTADWGALARSSPWLLFIALWFAFLRYGTGYLGARAWEKRHPPDQREIDVELDDSGFRTRSYPGELQLRWEALLQVVETEEFLLFYPGPQLAHYLPKSAVPGTDLDALRSLLARVKGKDFRQARAAARVTAG